MNARLVLDLIDVSEDGAALCAWLRAGGLGTAELIGAAMPRADRTTRQTAASILSLLGVVDGQVVIQSAATALADAIDMTLDVRAELEARQPLPASRLVVTATTSPELGALRTALGLRPLFHLIEDVVRSAERRCLLGAPYWNTTALERLRPAVMGFAARGGVLEFVYQAGDPTDSYNPVRALRRFCQDVRAEGGSAVIWAFDVRADDGARALLHAKFALADTRFGYLGSANMTGQGFAEHFEIGVRLTEAEATDLGGILDRLRLGGFLVRDL